MICIYIWVLKRTLGQNARCNLTAFTFYSGNKYAPLLVSALKENQVTTVDADILLFYSFFGLPNLPYWGKDL